MLFKLSIPLIFLFVVSLLKINLNSNKMVFFVGDSILITKLIDGNFPDYKRVIPKDNNNILKSIGWSAEYEIESGLDNLINFYFHTK